MSSSALVDGMEKIRFTAREALYRQRSHAIGVGRHLRTYAVQRVERSARRLACGTRVVVVAAHDGEPLYRLIEALS